MNRFVPICLFAFLGILVAWQEFGLSTCAGSISVSRAEPFVDRDYRDFATLAEAQAYFEEAGPGDPHRVDGDGDGVAYELNSR